ncbi:Flp pilus assembly protein CpaB [Sinisalibacter aestuarii]|uniref:Flp pilus assembly protein CpaB n=1 Tax=Sinisalibacter aestuarii TaxID=2949426 RepID=A0ABQ5LZ84_9RHOB|nr:Flp pilus assembly protein CpaB [Sinisalibacter aestuarii]GKY89422.1 Flp pilus assembly protein CpaB [Sinisalibacter aestuarii]
MRAVFSLVLVLGVGLAGFAVYMAKGVFGDYQSALAAERAARANVVETTSVFVVKEGVRYGTQITEQNIRAVNWPKSAIPEGAFTSLDTLFPEGEKRFRTVLRTMEKDEAILAVKVTGPGQDAGVASRLATGMRAFAIRVDVTSGVSGFLAPGDRVDVYWTGRASSDGERRAEDVTKLIESNIQIIAIDQTADLDRTSPTVARTVTVEATPQQVAALAQARATGRLTLSLVGHGDDTVAENVEVDQDQLLGIERRVVEAEQAPQICTVRTRKGGEIVETPIPCPTN